MREVIYINKETDNDRKVKFTQRLSIYGWKNILHNPSNFTKVVYLGKDMIEGDMFAAYSHDRFISIYKGHLNSGKY